MTHWIHRSVDLTRLSLILPHRFTKAERELQAARPFGYGPRKFYESSQLVKGAVDVDPKKDDKAPPPVAEKPEDKETEKKLKRIYIAVTSDRGRKILVCEVI